MADSKINFEQDGEVGVITIDGPTTLNALSTPAAIELNKTLDHACRHARAILLTGAGKTFCTGADLSAAPPPHWTGTDGRMDASISLHETFNPLTTRLRNLPIPLVTAVKGAAAGFGCVLALMGDIVVAGESAYFLQAFGRVGLVPDGGSTYVLSRLAGKARAMEMVLLGEKIPAARAAEWGLINRVVPDDDVRSAALALARKLSTGPVALRAVRRLIWEGLDANWHDQAYAESIAQRDAAYSEDFAEGLAAFRQKRAPAFKGR